MGRFEVNPKLRGARLALRLSQDGFARRLGSHMRDRLDRNVAPSGNLIGMWERGESRPGLDYRRGLTSFTGMTEFDLGLTAVPSPRPPSPIENSRESEDTNRRDLLLRSAVTAGTALLGLPMPDNGGVSALERPTPDAIADLKRLADLHRDWLYEHGASPQVQRGITHLLNRSSIILTHAHDRALRRSLLGAVSDISGVAAYTCRDLGLHTAASQHYLVGIQAAQAAGHNDLAGHLVVRMAGHQAELRQPDKIFAHLEVATRIGAYTSRQVSNQRALAAWAHAMQGDQAAVRRLVGEAEAAFAAPSQSEGAAAWQSRHVHESELFSLTGAGLASLTDSQPGYAPEAISRLTRALKLRAGSFSRNAILDHLSLAEAFLAAHELQPALDTTHQALRLAEDTSSHLVTSRLRTVSAKLRPHHRNPDVADLVHLIAKENLQ